MPVKLVDKSTHRLDGGFLVMDLYQYDDGECRAEVMLRPSGAASPLDTRVMLQRRASIELAVAAIARDFTTFAARALAVLPTIGLLADDADDADDEAEEQ